MVPGVSTREPRALFEAMFRTHYRAIEAYVHQVWPSVDEDDILSRTFEIAWQRFDEVPATCARGWLIGVAKNCALNALRSQRRRQTYVDAFVSARTRLTSGLHDETVPWETTDALQSAFATLREADQEVLLLSSWGGLIGDELGAALRISGSTASVRLFRARERLRQAYTCRGGEA